MEYMYMYSTHRPQYRYALQTVYRYWVSIHTVGARMAQAWQEAPWAYKVLYSATQPVRRDAREYLLTIVLLAILMLFVSLKIKFEKRQKEQKLQEEQKKEKADKSN